MVCGALIFLTLAGIMETANEGKESDAARGGSVCSPTVLLSAKEIQIPAAHRVGLLSISVSSRCLWSLARCPKRCLSPLSLTLAHDMRIPLMNMG
jgi:hypothetical protein